MTADPLTTPALLQVLVSCWSSHVLPTAIALSVIVFAFAFASSSICATTHPGDFFGIVVLLELALPINDNAGAVAFADADAVWKTSTTSAMSWLRGRRERASRRSSSRFVQTNARLRTRDPRPRRRTSRAALLQESEHRAEADDDLERDVEEGEEVWEIWEGEQKDGLQTAPALTPEWRAIVRKRTEQKPNRRRVASWTTAQQELTKRRRVPILSLTSKSGVRAPTGLHGLW